MASGTMNTLSMLFMAFVLMAVASELASASSFTVYRLSGCSGESQTYRCGCNNLLYMGDYRFTYTGQTARMYNTRNCLGDSVATLSGSGSRWAGIGWRSVNLQC
ncbi:antimicrobial peptide 1-like [Papaver somniferum]|uniref:antimicrobial peptide 1-like n=1 Tax=Papaver somniferum TaxID=3469 RepID=UPI000E6F525C|nr:antimicrobial peptide 1-like [Papaver somniferum]